MNTDDVPMGVRNMRVKRIFVNGLWYIHDADAELTTLRERVRELESCKSLVALDQLIKITEQNLELSARIRELEQAMPDAGFLRATADDVFRGVALVGAGKDLLVMASRIESVMTKQPEEKNE